MLLFTTFERARLIPLCGLGLKAECEMRKDFEICLCTGASSLWAKASSPQVRQPEFNLWSPQGKEKGLWKSSFVLATCTMAHVHGAASSTIIFS